MRGVGDIHVAVALARLERKFGVHVATEEVRVEYRETILASGQAEGKVKKQSGGHGQYAVANLRVAPLGRGDGFQFVDAVVGGAIPKNYVAAVSKGVEEATATGGAHGFPVVDVRVECYDGKTHSVDSSDMAFKTAAATGLPRGRHARDARCILEPISLLTVDRADRPPGRRAERREHRAAAASSAATSTTTAYQMITAQVPTAELQRYAMDLRAMTAGRGTFWSHHDHYDVLPSHLVQAVHEGRRATTERRNRRASRVRPTRRRRSGARRTPRCAGRGSCA